MNNTDFAFTSGLIAIGGYTVREITPFLKLVRKQYENYEYLALDSLFGVLLEEEEVKSPTYVELLVDDPLFDPRKPFDSRYGHFEMLLKMQGHFPNLVIVVPVTYRNFYIGGDEPKVLKHRLFKSIYRQLDIGVDCRRSTTDFKMLVAYGYDFSTQISSKWLVEDTYNEEEEWFRACGDCICGTCGKTYREHPRREIFHELCNGQLVKL
jgi:hypothetical protein